MRLASLIFMAVYSRPSPLSSIAQLGFIATGVTILTSLMSYLLAELQLDTGLSSPSLVLTQSTSLAPSSSFGGLHLLMV